MDREFLRPLPDEQAQIYVESWRHLLGVALPVRTERTSIWQVTNEKGRYGCGLVGVLWNDEEAKIVHTRRLTQEDIVHELLHVAHPAWTETQVVSETHRLLTPPRPFGESAPRWPVLLYPTRKRKRTKMAFSVKNKKSGTEYFLHAQVTPTKGGDRTLYFFSKEQKAGVRDALPEGYEVTESKVTGLPLLKRTASAK